MIVPPDAVDIAAQTYAHTATLFACHPPGEATERIVVKLALLGPDGALVDAEADLPPIDAGTQRSDHTLVVQATDPLSNAGA